MCDEHQRALLPKEPPLQPTDRVNVQVVGRLVQEKHVRLRVEGKGGGGGGGVVDAVMNGYKHAMCTRRQDGSGTDLLQQCGDAWAKWGVASEG